MSEVVKFFTKTAVSAARSLLLSEVKGGVKSFLNNKRAKTIDDIHASQMRDLGYITEHYAVHKTTQELSYKPSTVFFHEWLTNSPSVQEKIVRDEESGQVYIDGELITGAKKLDLINRFVKATNIKVAGLSSHMDNALKLIDVSDFNAAKFKTHFAGWEPQQASVIDQWLQNCFGVEDQFSNILFRKWIIGTAHRIINPGIMFDGCLTLKGAGMIGKTSFFRNLLPPPFSERANEVYCNPKNPQRFVENIIGKSICCFDELQVLDYARSVETFKQILTTQTIDVRLAYRRDPIRFKLRSGFAATTNKDQFIKDPYLSRRLWIIDLVEHKLDFDYLFANRDNLWREAIYLASSGESHFLSNEEKELLENRNATYLV